MRHIKNVANANVKLFMSVSQHLTKLIYVIVYDLYIFAGG